MDSHRQATVTLTSALSGRYQRVYCGAGDRFRTDDLVLGKHALYQLSYTRPLRIDRG
jgi:hypothetical protein